MRLFVVIILLLGLSRARGAGRRGRGAGGIVRNDFETPAADGAYRWALQTEDGFYHEQVGTPAAGGEGEGLTVRGQYQYTAPDGQVLRVVYVADAAGFRAEGAHLPTPPPHPRARPHATTAQLHPDTI